MERDLKGFQRRQAYRLLEIAKECKDKQLQSEVIAIADQWLKDAETPPIEAAKAS